jgi:sulfur carrier protein ThiS
MRIHVRLFSHFRSLLPAEARGQLELDVAEGTTIGFLLNYLGIAGQVKLVTVNNEPEPDRGRELHERDVLRIFPPVVGG